MELSEFWYRGTSRRPSMERFTQAKHFRREQPFPFDAPKPVVDAFHSNHFDCVSRIYGAEFVIRRVYDGMQNWGFGVYLGSDLAWSGRYGRYTYVVKVPHDSIASIHDLDFAKGVVGTAGGDLKAHLESRGLPSVQDQAPEMYRAVKAVFGKKKKALFVHGSPDDETVRGQLICFDKNVIDPQFYAE